MLVTLLLGLTACVELIGSVEAPELVSPPSELTENCPKPILLPESNLTQVEVETLWIEDRSSLLKCGDQKKALQEFYSNRDYLITGKNEASIAFHNLTRSAASAIVIEVSEDGGSTFTNTGQWDVFAVSAGSNSVSKAQNYGTVAGGVTIATLSEMQITGLALNNYPVVFGQYAWSGTSWTAMSRRNQLGAVTHIRIRPLSGTMTGVVECVATKV